MIKKILIKINLLQLSHLSVNFKEIYKIIIMLMKIMEVYDIFWKIILKIAFLVLI